MLSNTCLANYSTQKAAELKRLTPKPSKDSSQVSGDTAMRLGFGVG